MVRYVSGLMFQSFRLQRSIEQTPAQRQNAVSNAWSLPVEDTLIRLRPTLTARMIRTVLHPSISHAESSPSKRASMICHALDHRPLVSRKD